MAGAEWQVQRSGKETPSGLVGLEPRECEVGTTGCKGCPGGAEHDLAGPATGTAVPGDS